MFLESVVTVQNVEAKHKFKMNSRTSHRPRPRPDQGVQEGVRPGATYGPARNTNSEPAHEIDSVISNEQSRDHCSHLFLCHDGQSVSHIKPACWITG